MAAGRRGESTPLIGSHKRQSFFLTGASVSLCTVALCLVAFHSNGPVALQQKTSNQQIMLAKALLHKGEDLEDAGQQDMAMAKLMLEFHGSMLAVNDTNSTDDTEARKTLEEHGVNVDMWPQNNDVKHLPHKDAGNASEVVERVVTKDHDWYHYEPMKKAGVNLGKWFWEDDDTDNDEDGAGGGGNATEAGAEAGAANATDSGEEEEESTPEERLRKAGIKVDGFPWEPVAQEEEDDKEEEKEEEKEEAEPEEAAAKAPKIGLYQRGREAYKQYQVQMAQRLHSIKKVH